ncbi:MAG TPA: 16S rRNA (cytidine(1402)-2'-O)-methyltransferase [Bryobacteraceae bacterium]|nr:16S rRNA (cytidine(1402)-2'-O)-methyltransferase [Bryobacteraceae bacterium]
MSGSLFLVATPIGNLEDITFRAVRTLKEVDLIACEDTRHTRRLLDHYGIEKPAISYHDHNETDRARSLVERLLAGSNIAVVSDAGTPLISDPGYRLVTAAVEAGIRVIPIPGPSAILAALTASGLTVDSFYFGGFVSQKQSARCKLFEALADLDCSLVFYEAPHRILETLRDISEIYGNRQIVLTRELTKIHEEFLRGTALALLRNLSERESIKGEMTIVIGKPLPPAPDDRPVREVFEGFLSQGLSRMDAIKATARHRGVSKREIYAALET